MTEPTPTPPAPRVPEPLLAPPHRGRVLVVAPHPDDESIGPGGTVALHVELGDPVGMLCVTSGVHGDARGRFEPGEYIELRRREARAAAAVLGMAEPEFWEYPDSMVVTDADLAAVVDRLAEAFLRLAPDVLYVPHLRESHSDHYYVGLAALRARHQAGLDAAVLGYEVWSPLEADVVVDVSPVYPRKLEAVRCYRSQLDEVDIERAVDGLNRFRSSLLPDKSAGRGLYGEVFQRLA